MYFQGHVRASDICIDPKDIERQTIRTMGHNLTACSRGSRVVDLRSEMTRLRSNYEKERRTREQLGQMLTLNEREKRAMRAQLRDWVINRNEIQFIHLETSSWEKERGELFTVGNFMAVMSP